MKKLLLIVLAFTVILQAACSDSTKNNNKNLLLLLLLINSPITVKSSSYNDGGTLQMYTECVYPSSGAYLQSQKIDINDSIFPTIAEIMSLVGGATSSKTSEAKGGDGVWFTADDTFFYAMN